MVRGSSPAFTPITIASDVIAIAVAERRLLASFITWPMPGALADMEDAAEGREHRLEALEERPRTGRHHRERALRARRRRRRSPARRAWRCPCAASASATAAATRGAGGGEIDEGLDALRRRRRRPRRSRPRARCRASAGSRTRSRRCRPARAPSGPARRHGATSGAIAASLTSKMVRRWPRIDETARHRAAHAAHADKAEMLRHACLPAFATRLMRGTRALTRRPVASIMSPKSRSQGETHAHEEPRSRGSARRHVRRRRGAGRSR